MSDHDEKCELRRAIDAVPVDCRCRVRSLQAEVRRLQERWTDITAVYAQGERLLAAAYGKPVKEDNGDVF